MNKELSKQLELLRSYKEKACLDLSYKLLIDYIDKLEQENNQLKEEYYKQIEEYQKACDEVTSDKMDLENIIKELRSWLEEEIEEYNYDTDIQYYYKNVLNVLNKLEGKNE